MFEFLKKLMTNNESVSAKETNFLHRLLNSDIKEEPKSQEDEIIFGCGCFWVQKNVSGNFQELLQLP